MWVQTDLQVMQQVVEQNDLQQQFFSSDDVRRKIQGQEEILERCELQGNHETAVSTRINWNVHIFNLKSRKETIESTCAGVSIKPRPRFSDITKAVATHVVMLSGTVRGISEDTELLQKKTQN